MVHKEEQFSKAYRSMYLIEAGSATFVSDLHLLFEYV